MASPVYQSWWKQLSETGDISPIQFGMCRDDVRRILGEPDDTGGTSRKYPTPAIWRYNQLEFHFGLGESGLLNLIYMEEDGERRISISPSPDAG